MRRYGYLHSDAFLPSMFVRRLTLLLVAAAAVVAVLVVQVYRLTVLEGDRWREVAEASLYVETYTPTTRGRIVDRRGRVLAEDRPAFDVLVDFEVVTGGWADRRAEAAAKERAGNAWSRMSPGARLSSISAERDAYAAELGALWDRLAAILDRPRAELDAERDAIKRRVQRMKGHLWSLWLEERQEALLESGRSPGEAELAEVATPIREQVTPHAIATGVTESQASAVRRLAEEFEGVSVRGGVRRVYPMETVTVRVDRSTLPAPLRPGENEGPVEVAIRVEGLMPHVVGRMRPLNRVRAGEPLDTERRPERDPQTGELDLGHYRSGDTVGGAGVEASREDVLRGLRGYTRERLDTGDVTRVERREGRDVRLTIDAMLQARIRAALDPSLGLTVKQPWHKSTTVEEVVLDDGSSGLRPVALGTELNAAVVVLDIETAGVLAMVTHPSFTREKLRSEPTSVFGDPSRAPWLNRAVSKPYAPGSTVKPLVLCAAVTEGSHSVGETIECHGHLFPERPDVFRDWIYKQYGTTFHQQFGRALHADEAIGVSSNIYFYTLGMELGWERLAAWYRRFGVGESMGLGVGMEYAGRVLSEGRAPTRSDAILMGIGQGPIAWTPMHAADAYATLARSGTRILPRLDRDARPSANELHLDPSAVDAAIEGLRYAVEHEWGSAHSIFFEDFGRERVFSFEGLDVLAKTGTATANATLHDPDGPEGPGPMRVLRDGDHAWCVGLVGREGQPPRFAFAVLVEYAGSGGRVSGPIAAQVIHALLDEGYL